MSQTYRIINDDQKNIEYLEIQHGKILILKFQQYLKDNPNSEGNLIETMKVYQFVNSKISEQFIMSKQFSKYTSKFNSKNYFSFNIGYLKKILITLVKSQNENLSKIYKQSNIFNKNYSSTVQLECEMIDFMVYLWKQIYVQILKESYKKNHHQKEQKLAQQRQKAIKKTIKEEIRLLMAYIEQLNYKYQYLAIHLMMAINQNHEFTSKIFRKFLRCKNEIVKGRLFIWLNQVLGSSKLLQQQVIRSLKEIIQISKQQSRMLLQNFYEGKQKQIIKKIDNDPSLQLQYVELILKNTEQQIEQYYTSLHVQLILELKPQSLLTVLENNNELVKYDIGQVLKLTLNTKQFDKKNEILIYLYEKQGQIIQCIDTYLKEIETLIFSYIAITQKKLPEDEDQFYINNMSLFNGHNTSYVVPNQTGYSNEVKKIVDEINKKYQELIRLIFRQPKLQEQYIHVCLDKFNGSIKSILRSNFKHREHYLNFISQYFGSLIIEIFQRGCLEHLSNWIQQDGKRSHLMEIREYLIQGYTRLHAQNVILARTVSMQKKILLKQIHQTCLQMQYCVSSESLCLVCDEDLKKIESHMDCLLFQCGHIYHKDCIQQINGEDYCYQCVSKNQYKSMIQNFSLNLVQLLTNFKLKRQFVADNVKKQDRVKVKRNALISLEKKRTNRLALYDKMTTAIQAQAQIIDLKLMIEDYYQNRNDN